MSSPRLGVCYYPEHWPEAMWPRDAERMAEMGLKQVRIGEFAWSRLEPSRDDYRFDWLDRAIGVLGAAGLGVVLGTPTATPPKWLIDAHPDILAHDRDGRPRGFGSRRHYCFSSPRYRAEAARIVEKIAARYGRDPRIVAWQTDNEYGCHNTVRSYSPAAKLAFRHWLAARYGSVDALNEAWGAVFWSLEYRSFDEIDLPNLTVTEPNPSHVLDFSRFASDEVVAFNRMQTDILRRHSPGKPIMHNYMGFYFEFDHFRLSDDIDIAAWDSYPLGFLDVFPFPAEDKAHYLRQGHPDIAAFHHDLYRACGRGRWQVIEQQPGPVNWARHNPAPLDGMVRLWTLEAIAHGAEAVSYFRWRQAPFAQEQMHAGLLRPDSEPAPGAVEARMAADDLARVAGMTAPERANVAIVFSYEAAWLFDAQPQGAGWSYPFLVFAWYSALRRLGLNVDFLRESDDFSDYALVLAPSLPIISPEFVARVEASTALFLFGPRTGAKSASLTIPAELPPGPLQALLPLKVGRSESLPRSMPEPVRFRHEHHSVCGWLDHVETALPPLAATPDGKGVLYRSGNALLFTAEPATHFLARVLDDLLREAGVESTPVAADLRLRRTEDLVFAFNYGPEPINLPASIAPNGAAFVLGDRTIPPAGFACWRREPASKP
jgi:beta-galactosidase